VFRIGTEEVTGWVVRHVSHEIQCGLRCAQDRAALFERSERGAVSSGGMDVHGLDIFSS